jgi:cytochrome c553
MVRQLGVPVLLAGCLLGGLLGNEAWSQPAFDPEAVFRRADTNGDGKLSEDEFLALTARMPRLKDNPDQAKKLFDRLDTNGDGFLSLAEFRKIAEMREKQPGPTVKEAPKPGPAIADKPPTPEQISFFEKKIRPVLVAQCYKCHSAEAEKIKGKLVLDTRDGTRKGGETGPAVVPGDLRKSLLIQAIRYHDDKLKMPPKQKLSDEVISDFEAWVRMGAPDPRDGTIRTAGAGIDVEKGRRFWSFQPPVKTAPPEVKNAAWPRTDTDRFLLAALEAKGLQPVGDADRLALLRRVYLDLIGLPPTPEEVAAFQKDASPKAFETVVDRLLGSPRFGERWARHWLDLARYAETSGKAVNVNYPQAWRYRDYVIKAFNLDLPYDSFIKEQLAGDLLPTNDPKVRAERLTATGFLALGPKALNERNGLQFELDVADEQIDVTTQAFLGITAACARCHDHKFDPIPQKDYYALAGIFRSTETCYGTVRFIQSQRPSPLLSLPKDSGAVAAVDRLTPEQRKRIEEQIKELAERKVDQPIQRLFIAGQTAILRSRLDSFDAEGNPKLQAMGVQDKPVTARGFRPGPGPGGPPFAMFRAGSLAIADSPIYTRGEVDKPGTVVPRGFLQVLPANQPKIRSGSGRLELAEWIASKNNPLTARVMVNRVWMHLFGRGIVPTPDNFGAAGQPASNAQLLDHLALTFMENGWSIKKLIRGVVLSHAYQLDSRTDPKCFEADPDNALVWRMTPRRLEAEALRDAALAVSGLLDTKPPVGSAVARQGEGPTAAPRFAGGVMMAINDPRNNARSIYLPVVRDNLPEALSLFDAADPSLVVVERPTTTVPAQSLYLLNSPFALRTADAAADRLFKDAAPDPERVRAAYLLFYGRPVTEKELKTALGFLTTYKETARKEGVATWRIERDTWAAFCQALFASAEFQYRK